MPISNYPHGWANGVTVRGMPVLNSYSGNAFWVDSGNGSNGNDGTFQRPFTTIDYAVGRCTASNGDVIMVKAGHAETVTADSGIDVDVAGVSIVGLGAGADRPTITFTTAATADFKLAANNTSVENFLFVAGIDALTGPIEVSADDCAIINCEYRDDDTNNYETTDVIVTASTPLRMLIDGFRFVHDGGSGGTQNQSVIQLNGADKAVLRNLWIVADSGTGVIEDATTSDQILIENSVIESTEASPTVAMLLTATTTGSVHNTYFRIASGTTYFTAANDMTFFESFGSGTDATTGEKVATQLAGDVEAKIDVIDAYHDVASADASTNTVMSDVVGNKTDAAVLDVTTTASMMAYQKGLMGSTIRTAVKTGATMTSTADPIFTVAGGPVQIISIVGRVTTVSASQANDLKLQAAVTDPAGDTDMSTAVETNADAVGTIYHFVGPTAILTPVTAGAAILDYGSVTVTPSQWIMSPGDIEAIGAQATHTGNVEWSCAYFPLSPSATLVAAA